MKFANTFYDGLHLFACVIVILAPHLSEFWQWLVHTALCSVFLPKFFMGRLALHPPCYFTLVELRIMPLAMISHSFSAVGRHLPSSFICCI